MTVGATDLNQGTQVAADYWANTLLRYNPELARLEALPFDCTGEDSQAAVVVYGGVSDQVRQSNTQRLPWLCMEVLVVRLS